MFQKLHTSTLAALALALIGFTAFTAQAQSLLHARVSYDSGALLVRGQDQTDWAHSTLNTLVLPGDTMWVDQEGLGEIEFAGGSFLRLADGSKVEVTTMDPTPTVRGWTGSFYVQRLVRSTGDFIVKTPVATIEVDENTAVRIDILANGATTVTTRWGLATVRGASGGGANAVSGQRMWVDPGLLPSDPANYDRSQVDVFDEWNQERAALLAGEVDTTPEAVYSSAPAPATVIGATSLGGHGNWINVDNSHYWQPTVANYVPYRNGYWNYVPTYGQVWVGAEPFSYYTSHYGYWDYRPSYGWLWSYTGNWQPAYVTALHCNGYYMWSPITHHHYPSLVTDSFHFNVGGVNFSLYASSYVSDNYLYSPYHVNGMTYDIADHFYHNNGSVNIWNINIVDSFNNNNVGTNAGYNPRNPTYVPYDDAVQGRVRDYNPSRSVRGTSTLAGQSVQASERVRSLESNQGRSSFDVKPVVSGGALTRTAIDDTNRVASVRNVRLDEDANIMSLPRNGASTRTPSSTTPSTGSIGTRGAVDAKPTGQTRTPGSTPSTSPTTGDTVVRSRGAVDANPTGQTRIPTVTTPPSTSNPSGSRSSLSGTPTVSAPSTRTSIPDSTATRTRSSVPSTQTTPSTVSRTPTRDVYTGRASSVPAPSSATSTTRGSYTPTTRAIPSSVSPQTTTTSRPSYTAPVTTRQNSAPSYTPSTRQNSAPSYTPAPSRQSAPSYTPSTRQNSAPSYTPAPTRQSAPSYTPAPSRQNSAPSYTPAPSRQNSAPSYTPAPSRQSSGSSGGGNSRSFSSGFNSTQSRGSDARPFSAPSNSSRGSVSTNSSRSSSGISRSTASSSRGNNR